MKDKNKKIIELSSKLAQAIETIVELKQRFKEELKEEDTKRIEDVIIDLTNCSDFIIQQRKK